MALYKMDANRKLIHIPTSTFAALRLQERIDIQPLLRDNLEAIDADLFLISESFRDWEGSSREVDVLALDRDGNLVVIELKRTDDAGHAELQAVRYAAMLAPFSLDDVVEIHEAYCLGKQIDASQARSDIEKFLRAKDGTLPQISNRPRILLIAAGFSREVTTTVLWLNDMGLDIRCYQMQPYLLDGNRYLDIEQIIPLPSAQDYTFGLRRKSVATAQQNTDNKRGRSLKVLIDAKELLPGDSLVLVRPPRKGMVVPESMKQATFKSGATQGILWHHDGDMHSLSAITVDIYYACGGKNKNVAFTGPYYWAKEGETESLWDKAERLISGVVSTVPTIIEETEE